MILGPDTEYAIVQRLPNGRLLIETSCTGPALVQLLQDAAQHITGEAELAALRMRRALNGEGPYGGATV